MNASHFAPRIHWVRWLRRGVSHLVALAVGVALTLALAPRATLDSYQRPVDPGSGSLDEFHRGLQAVMLQMGAAMCVTPSADPDRDFAQAMIPHHQGAVEMAQLELLYGQDPRLRRLAQGIVVEQSQEIAVIHAILASHSTKPGANLSP